ncbi:hypothetical protein NQZ68_013494 [Dissostichus eleginoides]|nr:hypothetical protein NQZ68_013494 [Dissostichus eleginoides]
MGKNPLQVGKQPGWTLFGDRELIKETLGERKKGEGALMALMPRSLNTDRQTLSEEESSRGLGVYLGKLVIMKMLHEKK